MTCSPRPWENAIAVIEIDRQDLRRGHIEPKRDSDDAASRGSDDEIEVVGDRRAEVLFPGRQGRRREDPAQSATVECQYLEKRSARTLRPGQSGVGPIHDGAYRLSAGGKGSLPGAIVSESRIRPLRP